MVEEALRRFAEATDLSQEERSTLRAWALLLLQARLDHQRAALRKPTADLLRDLLTLLKTPESDPAKRAGLLRYFSQNATERLEEKRPFLLARYEEDIRHLRQRRVFRSPLPRTLPETSRLKAQITEDRQRAIELLRQSRRTLRALKGATFPRALKGFFVLHRRYERAKWLLQVLEEPVEEVPIDLSLEGLEQLTEEILPIVKEPPPLDPMFAAAEADYLNERARLSPKGPLLLVDERASSPDYFAALLSEVLFRFPEIYERIQVVFLQNQERIRAKFEVHEGLRPHQAKWRLAKESEIPERIFYLRICNVFTKDPVQLIYQSSGKAPRCLRSLVHQRRERPLRRTDYSGIPNEEFQTILKAVRAKNERRTNLRLDIHPDSLESFSVRTELGSSLSQSSEGAIFLRNYANIPSGEDWIIGLPEQSAARLTDLLQHLSGKGASAQIFDLGYRALESRLHGRANAAALHETIQRGSFRLLSFPYLSYHVRRRGYRTTLLPQGGFLARAYGCRFRDTFPLCPEAAGKKLYPLVSEVGFAFAKSPIQSRAFSNVLAEFGAPHVDYATASAEENQRWNLDVALGNFVRWFAGNELPWFPVRDPTWRRFTDLLEADFQAPRTEQAYVLRIEAVKGR